MATSEYKVIKKKRGDLERELNTLASEGWRPILISPDSFGGASFVNFGPGNVDTFCVILERDSGSS